MIIQANNKERAPAYFDVIQEIYKALPSALINSPHRLHYNKVDWVSERDICSALECKR